MQSSETESLRFVEQIFFTLRMSFSSTASNHRQDVNMLHCNSSHMTDRHTDFGVWLQVCVVGSNKYGHALWPRRRQATCPGECILSSWHRRQTRLCLLSPDSTWTHRIITRQQLQKQLRHYDYYCYYFYYDYTTTTTTTTTTTITTTTTSTTPAGLSVSLPLLIFPCTIKSRSSLLAPAHPGGPGSRARPQNGCGVWWCFTTKNADVRGQVFSFSSYLVDVV